MQINRSTNYAIQMLLYLSKANRMVTSSRLSAAIGISYRYLLQISAKLKAAGFIRAAHGPSGGLKLVKAPEEISIYDVILGMEGIIQTGEICGVPANEISEEMLMLKNEYRKVDCMLERSLKEITFARIMEADKNMDF